MKKTVSLKLNREFKSLYYRGGSNVSSHLVIYFKKNKRGENRLGITVSKKIGNAVTRNRVRRRISELYRAREDMIRDGFDIVIVARTRAAEALFSQLGASLDFLLSKSGLLK